jgi:5'-3' exonuclease
MTSWASKLPAQGSRHLLALDGTNIVRRAWHACVNDKKHEPERAAPTAIRSLARIIRARQSSHLVIGGEGRGSIRESIFAGYKAGRPSKPDGLLACEAQVEAALSSVGIQGVKVAGLEADDVLAGAVLLGRGEGLPVVLVSHDNDIEQLVDDEAGVVVWDGIERVLDDAAVAERWGVPARRLVELFALAGQDGDGIPGAPGIAKKTAAKILTAIPRHTLVDLFTQPHLLAVYAPDKYREKLREHRDAIMLSYDLVRLRGEYARASLALDDMAVDALHIASELAAIADRIASRPS